MQNSTRLEGLTLTVAEVKRSIEYYTKIGFHLEWDASPDFAMLRVGGAGGGTIGLLSFEQAKKEGVETILKSQARGIHVEISTDDLDSLYQELISMDVVIDVLPHDEPWERSMTAFDPDGYSVEFSQGRRGKA